MFTIRGFEPLRDTACEEWYAMIMEKKVKIHTPFNLRMVRKHMPFRDLVLPIFDTIIESLSGFSYRKPISQEVFLN